MGKKSASRLAIPSRQTAWLLAGCGLAALASITLRALIPPLALELRQDDGLAVAIANSLERGEWLGRFDNRTLAKGPGYPFFLDVTHAVGLPPTVGTQLVYLAGSAILAFGLWLWIRSAPPSAALFIVLALNPAMFGAGGSRVYREGFTAALSIVILGLSVLIAFLCAHRTRNPKWISAFVVLVIVAGLAAAWLLITRFDSVWVIVSAGSFALAAVFLGAATWRERGSRALALLAAVAPIVIITLGVQQAIIHKNGQTYGVALIDDYSAGPFAEASDAWASVEAGRPRPGVPITQAQRLAVYRISPTAKLLEPYLETPPATIKEQTWKGENCRQGSVCDEAGPWFPWMLRDAVIRTGTVHTPAQFEAFFVTINQDIGRACATNTLTCGEHGVAPGLPPLNQIDRSKVLVDFAAVMKEHLFFVTADPPSGFNLPLLEPDIRLFESTIDGLDFQTTAPRLQIGTRRMAPVVDGLKGAYTIAANVLLVAALIGLLFGIFTRGTVRAASALGVAALLGVLVHSAILAVLYSINDNWQYGSIFSYTLESEPFLLVALCIGCWSCWLLVRRIVRGRHAHRVESRDLLDANEPELPTVPG